jgi:hypothetical protein
MGFVEAVRANQGELLPCSPAVRGRGYQCKLPAGVFLVRQHSQLHEKCPEGSKGGRAIFHTLSGQAPSRLENQSRSPQP